MSRDPQCFPTWWVDGTRVASFHENTPIRDVYGIEIYRGPGEVPGEFAGSDAACGVIVIWTKSRPYR
jgi:outer membrane cobalamin receptor